MAEGTYLNALTRRAGGRTGGRRRPRLGIDSVFPGERIWVGNMWFYVVGILNQAVLTPEIDSSVLIGFPAAEKYLGFDGHPSEIDLKTQTSQVDAVQSVLADTANPENPNEVDGLSPPKPSRPGRSQSRSQLPVPRPGAVSLLVGAVGVANIMVISVLERRSEIGLRPPLGATKGHIRVQFMAESVLFSLRGGAAARRRSRVHRRLRRHSGLSRRVPRWLGGGVSGPPY